MSRVKVREEFTTSDGIVAGCVLLAITTAMLTFASMSVGYLWRLHFHGGRMNDGALSCLIAAGTLLPMCIVTWRLVRTERFWSASPHPTPGEVLKEWREGVRAPIVVGAALLLLLVIAGASEWGEGNVPRATVLSVLGVLGVGALATLPGAWMAARNAAADVPEHFTLGASRQIKTLVTLCSFGIVWAGFASVSAPKPPSIPQTPPSYCYSHQRVEGLIRDGLHSADSRPLVSEGSVVPESYCFTAPLPSPPRD